MVKIEMSRLAWARELKSYGLCYFCGNTVSRLAWARELKCPIIQRLFIYPKSRLAWARELKYLTARQRQFRPHRRALRGRVS